MSGRRATAALAAALSIQLLSVASAQAAIIQAQQQPPSHGGFSATALQPPSRVQAPRAPSGPPLGSTSPTGVGETTASIPSSEGDPLVDNGLSSPLCRGSTSGSLSSAAQSNCQSSDFVAAPAPTKSYEIDVNIDVGPIGLSKGGLLSAIQDAFVAPVWNAIEWVVHALVVMLEWCYTFNLLDGPTMSGVARALRQAQASFTQPWLTLVLAAASVGG